MRLPIILTTLLIVLSFSSVATARSPLKKKKFENPALKFEGTWRVERHDFREFVHAPADLPLQLQNETGAFPVGQQLRFEHTGSAILPGGIDPATMHYAGPVGEALRMTLLQPFARELCDSKRWDHVCQAVIKQGYSEEVMIDRIFNWTKEMPKEYATVWSDLLPLEYSLLHMGKSYHFGARFAKNGDMFIMVTIDGRAKGRGKTPDADAAADVGIQLRRVAK